MFDIPDFNEKTGEVKWRNNKHQIEKDFRKTFGETVRGNVADPHQSLHTSASLISGKGFAFGGKIINGFGMGGEMMLQTELSDISG